LQRLLREDLRQLGFQHRIAMAPTPLGACVLAAVQDGMALADDTQLLRTLARAPIAAARIAPQQVATMAAMGLHKLRQLFELPRAGLARRFGEGLLAHLDKLRGEAPDPREFYRPPDRFERRIEFGYEISHHPALLFPLRRLVADLAAYLAGRAARLPPAHATLMAHACSGPACCCRAWRWMPSSAGCSSKNPSR
jgi:protein ImuB